MTVFGSFINLKLEDKNLILRTFFLNYYVRLILWIFPFQRVQIMTQKMSKNTKKLSIDVSRLMWAVNVTSRYVFRSTCLTKALTAQIILDQYGHQSNLRIGVTKGEKFEAHAWVEFDGDVVMGKSENKYVPLVNME
jgi:hypothetical protein